VATDWLQPVRLWRIEATRGGIETVGAVETDQALWRLGLWRLGTFAWHRTCEAKLTALPGQLFCQIRSN
jgi:hypothetical protein